MDQEGCIVNQGNSGSDSQDGRESGYLGTPSETSLVEQDIEKENPMDLKDSKQNVVTNQFSNVLLTVFGTVIGALILVLGTGIWTSISSINSSINTLNTNIQRDISGLEQRLSEDLMNTETRFREDLRGSETRLREDLREMGEKVDRMEEGTNTD